MSESLRELLEDEFRHDPIYNLAIIRELEEYIWTEKILSMSNERTYDTVEASKFIDRPDATIRYYLRNEVSDAYIKPHKNGRYYKLDYYTIFKIHLVSMLIETGGMNTTEILTELGFKVTTQSNKNTPLMDDLKKLTKIVEASYNFNNQMLVKMQQQTMQLLSYEKKLSELKIDTVNYERLISDANREIKALETNSFSNYLLERQDQILVASLKRKPKGLLGIFKSENKEDLINGDIDKQLKDKQEMMIESEIKSIQGKIEDYNNKLNSINKTIIEIEQNYEIALKEQQLLIDNNKNPLLELLNQNSFNDIE